MTEWTWGSGLQAALGTAFTAVGVFVAWTNVGVSKRQAETNRIKLKLDLYDRRLKVYRATLSLLQQMDAERRKRRGARATNIRPIHYVAPDSKLAAQFRENLDEAPFLFEKGVPEFLRTVNHHVWGLRDCFRQLEERSPGDIDDITNMLRESARRADKKTADLLEKCEGVFRPYLTMH